MCTQWNSGWSGLPKLQTQSVQTRIQTPVNDTWGCPEELGKGDDFIEEFQTKFNMKKMVYMRFQILLVQLVISQLQRMANNTKVVS